MSKRDYYEVLGVAKTATDDDIKQAYRKLAMKWHPDRHQGDEKAQAEVKFKEVNEAHGVLSDPQKRAAYDQRGTTSRSGGADFGGHSINDIIEKMRRAHGGSFHKFRQIAEVEALATLKEAFDGFDFQIRLPDGKISKFPIPAGCPDGFRLSHDVNEDVTLNITVRIKDPRFKVKTASDCSYQHTTRNGRPEIIIETGDVETSVDVDALDIIMGAWVKITGFEQNELQLRVPAGFNVNQRLKVKGNGFYHWAHQAAEPAHRGDLYVKINPVFKLPKDLELSKVQDLEKLVASYHASPEGDG